ncbi:MAG TPA: P-loop NTPase fold protein [Nitrososphaera sp.]|nr:P-loop NTPase fold protein [Nitrososphaera sp.]
MEFQYLPDQHIQEEKEDFLNFKEAAKRTLAAIKNSRPPFTWAIYGDWGSGKTSLMRLIMSRMEDEIKRLNPLSSGPLGLNTEQSGPLHIPVWFDAWRYENEINIIYPLFHTIREDFSCRCPEEKNNESFVSSFKRVAYTSLFGLTDLGLRAATKAAFGEALTVKDVKETFEMVEKDSQSDLEAVFSKWTDDVTAIREAFEKFVEQYLDLYRKKHSIPAGRKLYLAVFIDDLDRCLPDVAIEILERIKNHLLSDRCIFILGINRNVVYKSISKKYGDLDIDGRQHLEKIIQHSVGVPRPSRDAIIKFGLETLKALVVSTGEYDLQAHFDEFSQTLYDAGFTNPRKIKRIMNHYLNFIMSRVEIHKDIQDFNLPTVIRLIILREYYQDFYDLFKEKGFEAFKIISAGTADKADKFKETCGEKWEHLIPRLERMKKLTEMNPGKKTKNQYIDAIDELFGLED